MTTSIPPEITEQVSQACAVIARHLGSALQAIHLYGSALDGGLKPYSDIDLLVAVNAPLDEPVRCALSLDLLAVSAPPGKDSALRALEVTVVEHREVVPWRYPARRELQFGEWLRQDLFAGVFEPAVLDIDLAILLAKVRQHSIALVGAEAEKLFEPVPEDDFFRALAATLKQWNSPADWEGDARNVILTVARIWYSAATGQIVPKDVAADWVLARLPIEYQPVVREAQQAYLGQRVDSLATSSAQTAAFIFFAKSAMAEEASWLD
jgi:streptomycin 3"-adenylyltransferase